MGLSHYPSAAEGMLPVIVMNTVVSVAILKSFLRWVLQVMGGGIENPSNLEEDVIGNEEYQQQFSENSRERKISVTLFKSLCNQRSSVASSSSSSDGGDSSPSSSSSSSSWSSSSVECCVCLHKFEADEIVSELSCNHFFHKGCLEKWLDHKHSTCPLCRSTL
ncbi:zinc finger protein [Macleaya cordata]|uniref:Zinc finger protein n=1 Tax=Macleaya cordata TaxID=56857 RepID=A0A200RCY9_MACCD|nr:zinc finger protein [Macleaya cordata]